MKFTDGFWQMREGVAPLYPAEIRGAEIRNNRVVAYASCQKINHRGQTISQPMITYELFSPAMDVIAVRLTHHKGRAKRRISFYIEDEKDIENDMGKDMGADISQTDDAIAIQSGGTRLVLRKSDCTMSFFYRDRKLTESGFRHAAYIADNGRPYMRDMLDLDIDACVYGLGERFTPFVKNGQVVDMWNEDGGTCSEIAYKNVPFYMTNTGYGVLVNSSAKVSFEVASEVVSRVSFSVPGETLEYCVIGGENPKQVISNYTGLTGRPPLLPPWSFGLWLSTSFTTNYDEATVSSFVDKMAEYSIPLSVFHFDCFWMKEFSWCDFTWDERVFPDARGMLARLKARGLRVCVWINPYIAQKSILFDEAVSADYLLKRLNGDVWQTDLWQAGMGIVDFTNPDACAWYQSKLQGLLDAGVDCFKTDFGERIPTDVVYHNGADPFEMHNYYSYLYNKTVFDLLERGKGKGNAIVFARSATSGSQQFPVHWGGDCVSAYSSMAESLRGGLSLMSSGFAYWSHDISGFENMATPDLYKRWAAFGLLSSHSRLHGSGSYRVPWMFDEEACGVLKRFTNLKCALMPYIHALSVEAAREGHPLIRPMFMEFPGDRLCDTLDKQYMLGDRLLVAPIFNERGEVGFYLPDGKWTDLLTRKSYEGGRYYKEQCDYFHIPLLARGNAILPIGARDDTPDYDYADGVTFTIFNLADTAEAVIYDANGTETFSIRATKEGNRIVFTVHNPQAKKYRIEIHGSRIQAIEPEPALREVWLDTDL